MNNSIKVRIVIALVVGLASLFTNTVSATLVTGWGLETGGQAATLGEGVSGSFTNTQPTGNAEPRALLSSSIDFSVVGQSVQFTGTVALSGSQSLGNQSFRFGLYNSNGHATGTLSGGLWSLADPVGWLGYMVEIGNGNGSGATTSVGRNGTTGGWFSGTGAYGIDGNGIRTGNWTNTVGAATFAFSLQLTRLETNIVSMVYSFIDLVATNGNDFSVSNSVIDTNGFSTAMTSFNAVGFLENTSSGGAASFSGVDVFAVPEPSTFALMGVGLGCGTLLLRRNRRRS